MCICIRIYTHQGPTLAFEHKWNLTSQLDKLRLSGSLVTLASGPSSNHLTSDSLSSQLVKSTCKVTPLKSHPQAVPSLRTPPEGYWGGGQVMVMAKKNVKIDHFFILLPQKFCENHVFWNYFAMFFTTRGHTATWQCCCGVGGFSATICRQYGRWDMPLTINCVLLPLDSHVWLTLLSLWADMGFVCRKLLWTFSFWGQWCVSRSRWKYASRYGREQHVGCVTYELRSHTTHAWNLPQVEWSKCQRIIRIGGVWIKKLNPL